MENDELTMLTIEIQRLRAALTLVRDYRDSRMGGSASRRAQQLRAEMNDAIDAALTPSAPAGSVLDDCPSCGGKLSAVRLGIQQCTWSKCIRFGCAVVRD